MTSDSDTQPDPNVQADDASASGILRNLAQEGYGTQFVPGPSPGVLRCCACGSVSSATDFRVQRERRLEGVSDPDDMVLIVAASCPVCSSGGAIVLGYGPNASADDTDLVMALERHTSS
jgi:hypothetical protein